MKQRMICSVFPNFLLGAYIPYCKIFYFKYKILFNIYQIEKNKRKSKPRHIVAELQNTKDKGKILKAARKRTDHLQRNSRQLEKQKSTQH